MIKDSEDVYKRQVLPQPALECRYPGYAAQSEALQALPPKQAVFASGAFFTLIALVEVLAMLLIGLDVYKRQSLNGGAFFQSTVSYNVYTMF